MVVTREERARRAAAFEVRSAGRDQEAAQFAGSRKDKKKADERLQSALRKQGEVVTKGRNMLATSAVIAPIAEAVVVVQAKAVVPVPDPPVFKLASFELGPRATVVNAPMTFMFTKPVYGSLMIMDGRKLMMTISFQPGDYSDLSRAWTVPRWSHLKLRVHTGRGTMEAGETVGVRPRPPGVDPWNPLPQIPFDDYAQPGDGFWDGMKRGFEWAAPLVTEMWEDYLGLDGDIF